MKSSTLRALALSVGLLLAGCGSRSSDVASLASGSEPSPTATEVAPSPSVAKVTVPTLSPLAPVVTQPVPLPKVEEAIPTPDTEEAIPTPDTGVALPSHDAKAYTSVDYQYDPGVGVTGDASKQCVWLVFPGIEEPQAALWPTGWRARFDPVRIYNQDHDEVWRAGQLRQHIETPRQLGDEYINRIRPECRVGDKASLVRGSDIEGY